MISRILWKHQRRFEKNKSCLATSNSNHPSGAVALVSALVISSVILIIGLGVNLRSLGNLQSAFRLRRSLETFYIADACVEEALLRLRRNSGYGGGSLSLGNGNCTITVTTSGSQKTVSVTATVDDFTRQLQAVANVTGGVVTITSWEEVE